MRIAIAALICLVAAATAAADTVPVGDVTVTIPNPEGFVAVTQNMAALYEFQKQLVGPAYKELLAFIPEGDVPAALKDEIPNLPRRFTAQISKKLVNVTVSASDFANLRSLTKTQNEAMVKKVEQTLPGLLTERNAALTKKYGVGYAVSALGMVPLALHEESDRTFAFSLFMKEANESAGSTPYVVVSTITRVLLKGKILTLYCYGEEADLEWTRESSRRWASAIIAANPLDVPSPIKEPRQASLKQFNGEEVGVNSIKGALVALVLGLFGWIRSRRKTS